MDLTFPQKNPFGPENQNVGVKCSIKNIVEPNEIGRPINIQSINIQKAVVGRGAWI